MLLSLFEFERAVGKINRYNFRKESKIVLYIIININKESKSAILFNVGRQVQTKCIK